MFNIIKGIIYAGGYKLKDIRHRIKKLYIMGDISEPELDELLSLASDGVSVDAERPASLTLIQTLAEEVNSLAERVLILEGGHTENETEYPVWKVWDGISKDYSLGAIVSHNGELWKSVFDGQNVWEPGVAGTEKMWEKQIL